MNTVIKCLVWMALASLIGAICGYLFSLMPEAMHEETMNQRAIAAGSLKHQVGYYEYQQFVGENHAQ